MTEKEIVAILRKEKDYDNRIYLYELKEILDMQDKIKNGLTEKNAKGYLGMQVREHLRDLEKFADAKVFKGVVRWKSNKSVPPTEFLFLWACYDKPFDLAASLRARSRDVAKSAREYRKQQSNYVPSTEELIEMQAAFGKGATIVDVISGKKYHI